TIAAGLGSAEGTAPVFGGLVTVIALFGEDAVGLHVSVAAELAHASRPAAVSVDRVAVVTGLGDVVHDSVAAELALADVAAAVVRVGVAVVAFLAEGRLWGAVAAEFTDAIRLATVSSCS